MVPAIGRRLAGCIHVGQVRLTPRRKRHGYALADSRTQSIGCDAELKFIVCNPGPQNSKIDVISADDSSAKTSKRVAQLQGRRTQSLIWHIFRSPHVFDGTGGSFFGSGTQDAWQPLQNGRSSYFKPHQGRIRKGRTRGMRGGSPQRPRPKPSTHWLVETVYGDATPAENPTPPHPDLACGAGIWGGGEGMNGCLRHI